MIIEMKTLSLYQLLHHFASADEWGEFTNINVNFGTFVDVMTAVFAKDKEATSAISKKAGRSGELRRLFQDRALARLQSGKFVAYGYSMPRRAEDQKVEIPIDVWKVWPSVSWENSTVKGQGLEFIQVGACPRPEPQQKLPTTQTNNPSKKVGRPAVRPNVLEAYNALNDAGLIDFSAPKSALYGPICDWLANQYPERETEFKSLDDSTIRKTISKQFDLDR